jgi:RND family efflux transporter MFP subunit
MLKINKKIISVVFILMLLALFFLKYLLQEKVQVRTAEAALRNIDQIVSYSGSVESCNRVRISSEIAGRVSAVFFEELDDVTEGQVMVKLENVVIKAQLNQAKEALNQAKINLVNAKKNLSRVKELFKRGFASKEHLDSAQQTFDVCKAMVKQNQSNCEMIDARLEHTCIRAPISGTVISKNVTVGEVVAGPLGGRGLAVPMAIAEIADLSNLEVRVDVDEGDIRKIKVGQEATISVDAFTDKTFKGIVKEIPLMTSGRRETGITYRVKVHIEDPEKILKLGMTTNTDFLIRSEQQVLTVPKSAILAQGGKTFVFTINDQKVCRKEVMTDIEGEEFMEVTSGLQPGEGVVIGIKAETGRGRGLLGFGQEIIPDDILKLKNGQSVDITP